MLSRKNPMIFWFAKALAGEAAVHVNDMMPVSTRGLNVEIVATRAVA